MNVQSLVPLLAAVVYVSLLAVLVSNRPWQKKHWLFCVYLTAALLWSLSTSLLRSGALPEHNLQLFRVTMFSGTWAAIQMYWFIRFLIRERGGTGLWIGYACLAAYTVGAVLGQTPQSISFDGGTITPSFGPWILTIFIPAVVLSVLLIYSLIRKLRALSRQEDRNLVQLLILATVILAVFGVTALFLPLGRQFPLSHLGSLLTACVLTYVTIRHELVSVEFIARRGLAWLVLLAVGVGAYLAAFSLGDLVLGIPVKPAHLAVATLGAVATAAAISLLVGGIIRRVDQLVYRKSYRHRQALLGFVDRGLAGVSTLKELGERLLPLIAGSVGCQRAYLLLPEAGTDDFVVEFAEPAKESGSRLRIGRDSPTAQWLRREKRHLIMEDLDISPIFKGLWKEERYNLTSSNIELLFPVINKDNLIGILALGRKDARRYSLDDIRLVASVTSQAAASLEKEYLQEQLRKREKELALINRLSSLMTSSLNLQEVYDAFVAGLREIVDVSWATIALIQGEELYFSALSTQVGSAWETGERIPLKDSAAEWVSIHKKALVEPDPSEKRSFWTAEAYVKLGIRSVVFLPLLVKGRTIGSLILASRQPNTYGPAQVDLLERLSSQIAMSVENSSLYAEAERRARVDELTGLYNRRHFDETLKQEVDRHSRYQGVFSLILLDLDSFKEYNDKHGHLAGDRLLTQAGKLIRSSVRGTDIAFRYGGDEFALILPESGLDEAFVVAERVRDMIAAEMAEQRTGVTASLGLASWPGDGVTLDGIVSAADQVLYYAKRIGGNRTCIVSEMLPSLVEPVVHKAGAEKEALSTIYALAAAIEARDCYTFGHSRKVSGYALALAEAIGLSAEKTSVLSGAAMLHDIGKLGIPDEVLRKAGPLSAQEWELVKSHPSLASTIVAHMPSLSAYLPAILHHHERWNGTGYPSGLKGESIPIEARILALADAFDAMTSSRPYRGPLSLMEAVDELKRGAGSQFDPALVDAFLPVVLARSEEEERKKSTASQEAD